VIIMEKNKKYLIVYNICGISGKDNTDYYIEAIKTIREQKYKDYNLMVSSCLNTKEQITKLKNNCEIDLINLVTDVLPVNITFNQAIRVGIEHFGDPSAILYLDSGVKFTSPDQLEELVSLFERGNFGMVSAQVDNDMGWCWFGLPVGTVINENFLVPVGKALNLHCQLFHIDIFKKFGGVMPDIFRSYCTESTFSFLNVAVNKQWCVSGKVKLHHAMTFPNGDINNGDGLDGHSSGFRAPHGTWNDVFSPHDMTEIISNPEALACGFGYEELRRIFLHNQNCYDQNGFCLDPERLASFIKSNIFRQKEDFDYNEIKQETLLC